MENDVQALLRRLGCKILLESDMVRRKEVITSSDKEVIIKIRPLKVIKVDEPEPPPNRSLGSIHKAIMAVLTTTPQTPRAILRAAGYSAKNSHARQALYVLHKLGFVLRSNEGYYLPADGMSHASQAIPS